MTEKFFFRVFHYLKTQVKTSKSTTSNQNGITPNRSQNDGVTPN